MAELGLELNPLSVFQCRFHSTEHRTWSEWLFSQIGMHKREVNSKYNGYLRVLGLNSLEKLERLQDKAGKKWSFPRYTD